MILWRYQEEPYANETDYLDEVDKFLKDTNYQTELKINRKSVEP